MGKVYVIGGMALDVEGRSFEKLVRGDSNPGSVHTSHGGVGRNITENLAKLGVEVGLVSVMGNDDSGRMLTRKLIPLGVDVDNIRVFNDAKTAMYLSLLDSDGTMDAAIASMDILDRINPEMLTPLLPKLMSADFVGLDANLSVDTLSFIGDTIGSRVPLFIDAVSTPKAVKLRGISGKFTIVKANRMEAGAITGIDTSTDEGVKAAAHTIVAAGSRCALITLDSRGVYYCNDDGEGQMASIKVSNIVSTTGAGDAFSAMALYGHLQGWPIKKTLLYAAAMSSIVIQSAVPVPEDLCLEKVRQVAENVQW